MALKPHLIGGAWVEGSDGQDNVNPSDLSDVVGVYGRADRALAEQAIAAAKAAFPAWSRSTPQQRLDILEARRRRDPGAQGRDRRAALARGGQAARRGRSARRCAPAQIFKFFAGEALRLDRRASWPRCGRASRSRSRASRVGVVGLITPWNFPIAIPAWKIAPALAYGNCVVLKPAELVPALRLGAGRDPRTAPASRRACSTWSWAAARWSARRCCDMPGVERDQLHRLGRDRRAESPRPASRPTRQKVQLEMGGKNPLVVLDDADLADRGRDCAVNGAFFSTGQRCTASSRLIVTEGIHDRFVEAVVERLKALKVDDALQPGDRDRPGGRPEPARPGPALSRDRPGGGRAGSPQAASGSSATPRASTSRRRCSPRRRNADAHQPRGDLRAGRDGDPGQGLRRGAGGRQRHRVRPVRRHLHDLAQARQPLQAQRRGRAW